MLQLPLNALRTFEAVAKTLSFTRGAETLNVSPAAVSSQIRTLEERLKQPLFKRQGRQVTLTDAGQLLLPGVQRGLDELRRAVQTLDLERNEGVLNVSMGPTFLQKWIMPRMNDFYRKHHGADAAALLAKALRLRYGLASHWATLLDREDDAARAANLRGVTEGH